MPKHLEHHTVFLGKFPKALRALFFSGVMRMVSQELSILFVPIYLYTVGSTAAVLSPFPLSPLGRGILAIALYYAGARLMIIPITVLASWMSRRHSLPLLMMIGVLATVLRYGALFLSVSHPVWLIPAVILNAVEIGFYWPARHALMAAGITLSQVGKQVGMFEFLLRLLQVMLPAISGMVVLSYGFSAAFLLSILFSLLSVIPLLRMAPYTTKVQLSWKGFLEHIAPSKRLFVAGYLGRYVHLEMLELWPVFLFLFVGAIERVGYLYSVSLLFSLIILYIAGWFYDTYRSRLIFAVGGLGLAAIWVLRMGVTHITQLISLETVDRIAGSMFLPGFEATLFSAGRRSSSAYAFFVYREILLSCTALGVWTGIVIAFAIGDTPWDTVFWLGGAGALVSSLVFLRRYAKTT